MTATIEPQEKIARDRRLRPLILLRAALRLVVSIALTFFGLTLVTFVIGRLIPIDPVLAIVGDRAPQDVYDAMRLELGLDQPLYLQYFHYLKKLLAGDFGISLFSSQPVLTDLMNVLPATIELATVAIVIGVSFGLPMGVVAASNQGRWPDHLIRVFGLIGYSMPIFWLGIVGLLLFYGQLGWVSGPGRVDAAYEGAVDPVTGFLLIDSLLAGKTDIFFNALSHIILPASLLGYVSLAYISRMTRSFMLGQLRQEYILTAQLKGLSRRRVIWRHALGNIMVPLITVIALSYGYLLEGAVLTETVFSWPGLGLYLKNSLFNADMNAVLGGTIAVGAAFIGLNMLSDLAYLAFDPRAR
jgi:peptide/nickel transport system permease protein